MKAGRQSSAMSLTGGGARQKRWRRPHERGLSVPKEPALLRDLEANQTAVHGSRRDRLDRLPLPWSAGRRTEGRAQRHVSSRAGRALALSLVFARRSLLVTLSSTVGRSPDLPLPSPPKQKNLQDFPKS